MAAASETCWKTTVLARNIHCASCTSLIEGTFARFGPAVRHVNISILHQTVVVHHLPSLSSRDLCYALVHAAFDVCSGLTDDEHGSRIEEIEFGRKEGCFGVARKWWKYSKDTGASDNYFDMMTTAADHQTRHMENCSACRQGDPVPEQYVKPLGTSMMTQPNLARPHSSSEDGNGTTPVNTGESPPSAPTHRHVATLLIGGMTCAACVSAVTAAIQALDCVLKVGVNLMTNSATIEYAGLEGNSKLVVDAVEDAGFEASIETCKQIHPQLTTQSTSGSDEEAAAEGCPRRSIMLEVHGMFCDHCPSRVVEALSATHPALLNIEQAPTIKEPILKLDYIPTQDSLTIRDIASTIEGVHENISASVYHPASLEDRSQLMQAQEQRRLLKRLILCCLVIVPTLLIGVIWMSFIPASHPIKKYFETAVWAGTVTREQWALFILATPIMFFAADVFHLRAFKEIRALWRPKSQVPILKRFYRFGSMSLLISAGTSVAYISSVALIIQGATSRGRMAGHGTTYFDSVIFLTFFILIGKYLEAYSKAKTGSAVALLGKLRPQEALLMLPDPKEDESKTSASTSQKISVDLLEIGDVVVVPHGSSPPADGTVVAGSSKFNESSLTGESRDVSKDVEDVVFAGTVNTGNPIHVEVTSLGGTSMLDQIISVVREGQTKRAPVERLVDTITGYFVPVITALAILTFIVWFALGQSGRLDPKYLKDQQGGWAFWSLEFAIAVFVVACPCGIGLAAPTALFVGGGLAAKKGILVRGGGEAFQEASHVDAVVFDKTGTLTEGGNPTVTDHQVLLEGDNPGLVWSITASLEETSSHPLARALLNLASTFPKATITAASISEEPGHGLRGTFTAADSNTTYEAAIGSEAFITTLQPSSPASVLNYFTTTTLSKWQSQSKSIALLAMRELPSLPPSTDATKTSTQQPQSWSLAAMFAISDPIRPSAAPTIAALHARAIPVYMLTGDNRTTALAVASTLSIPADHVFANCLPTHKSERIEWLKTNLPSSTPPPSQPNRKEKEKPQKATIAFIGDGINDAPALLSASVSIALSSSANDIALSAASFVLLSPSLETVLELLDLSRRVFGRIKANFVWACVYNVVLVPVAAGVFFRVKKEEEGGWRLGPVWGAAAMAASSVSVVVGSLALGWGTGGR
ncbi:MAG: hypothetical protein LQ344_004864 [Seirophora lacunosa]|nr:MAG: hypothetical protein LQ344_004864 [Seirophora lacunosa]